jgi:hypothetical protein
MNKEDRPEDKNDTSSARKSLERKAYERELTGTANTNES